MTTIRDSWLRLLCVTILVFAARILLNARNRPEDLPPRPPLSSFPSVIGDRLGRDVTIGLDVLRVLGNGEFMERLYSSIGQPPIDFFVAYFPTQRTGSTIHSPQNCLPGSGWTPVEFNTVALTQPDKGTIYINRYVIAKGLERQLMLYWYQSHGRIVASEYLAKLLLITDSIRMNRSDGALVRIVTPIVSNKASEAADTRAMDFAQRITPKLESYIPR